MLKRVLLSEKKINIILNRFCCQLIENHNDLSNTGLIGLQPRGIFLLNKIVTLLENEYKINNIKKGKLDTTFFRDDFRRSEKPISANSTEMEFSIEGKSIVIIDDVLYTGRSIRSALTAIDSYGRPKSVELLVLIDRRFSRHLPIQPDYIGVQVDSIDGDRVKVLWKETDIKDIVYLEKKNE
ncbi:MAG: bifunctional pyr operon transcriptional regulator/uracil phosphoribosyltransferase [Flavobacteriaceae bacterium]|nr:bifunctional pyr operon transcriptional regulator/uracil phosphoribosyltransferase [Flavobacteriaceae bacterium]|tara:strand:+ start:1979 stop:2524 length:546 start_codon:yes stop_codon:yes gene_type:complete